MNTCLPSLLAVLLLLTLPGCEQFNFRSQNPEETTEESLDDFTTRLETKLLGDYTTISGLNMITLEGVGLVTGLNGTGGDPPPSIYRSTILDIMRKRGIKNPNALLADKSTAIVVVRAYLPPLCKPGDRFDVEVRIPEGDESTSLVGGWLLETDLSEHALVPGTGVLKGHILAKAAGPILLPAFISSQNSGSQVGAVQRGRILGGAVSTKERNLTLYLRNDYRSVRMSKRVADGIGQRFHHYNSAGSREPLAEAKTDQLVELKLHPRYRDNFTRYLQVIRHISGHETPVTRRVRLQRLRDEIMNPMTAEKAALQLEAIGADGIPILKSALRSKIQEVRFHAAVALAYQGDATGLKDLKEAARDVPAFRIFALAAMGTIEDGESMLALRELLDVTSAETRYGAFRAMTTLDPYDPSIRGELLNERYMLHVLDSEGPPMVHMTHHKKSEITLFGDDLRFRTPIAVQAGNHILVTASPGSEQITVSRYQVGQADQRKVVSTQIEEVIRTVSEFGGSYPDISMMLVQADQQHALPSKLYIDELPTAGRIYIRPPQETPSGTSSQAQVGSPYMVPNLFEVDPNEAPAQENTAPERFLNTEPSREEAAASDQSNPEEAPQEEAEEKLESDPEPKKNSGWFRLPWGKKEE